MAQGIYIGTRYAMQWVNPAPSTDGYENSPLGWSTKQDFLNGGTRIRRSQATHRAYKMTWNMIDRDEARKITDLYGGTLGPGPIYFLDPFAMSANLAPAHWAAPMQGATDAPLLIKGSKPALTNVEANTLGYPVQTATYTSTGEKRKLFIPLPTGFTLWAGVHGPSAGGSLVGAPVLSPTNVGTGAALTKQSVNDNTRVSASWVGATNLIGVEFTLQDNASYTGFMVQVLPTGATPATGGFISGQGHSGTDFVSAPVQTPYSAVLNKIGVAIELEEVNDWL